jgi:nitrogen fixation protein FixH
MTSTPSTPAEGSSGGWTLTGRHVLGVVVGFFAVIIALNIWFLTLAYRTFPGQVSDTPYEDGLAFNQRLAAQAAQARRGWEAAGAAASPRRATGF